MPYDIIIWKNAGESYKVEVDINQAKALKERADSQPVSTLAKECFDLAASLKDYTPMAWIARELWDWDDLPKNKLLHQKLQKILSLTLLSEEEQREILENDSIRYYNRRDFSDAGIDCCTLSIFEIEKMLQLTKKLIPCANEETSRVLSSISNCCNRALDTVLKELVNYLDSVIISGTEL